MLSNALKYLASHAPAKQEYGSDELQQTVYSLYVLSRAGKADLGTMTSCASARTPGSPRSRAPSWPRPTPSRGTRCGRGARGAGGEVAKIERRPGRTSTRRCATWRSCSWPSWRRAPPIRACPGCRPPRPRDEGRLLLDDPGDVLLPSRPRTVLPPAGERPPYSGTVFAEAAGSGRSRTSRRCSPGSRGRRRCASEMNGGYEANSAYFNLLARGVPTDAAFKPDNAGLEVERTFTDRDGRAVNLDDVRQGDLVVVKVRVRPLNGPVSNVVVTNMLPRGWRWRTRACRRPRASRAGPRPISPVLPRPAGRPGAPVREPLQRRPVADRLRAPARRHARTFRLPPCRPRRCTTRR